MRLPWPFQTYAPQKGSRKLKAQRILILHFVLPFFFLSFCLSYVLDLLGRHAEGEEAEGLDGQM